MNIFYPLFLISSIIAFFLILAISLKRKSYSFKTIKVGNDLNVESRLRILMRKNPRSEIVVINRSTLSETGEILKKMQYDFPEIHIISY